MAQCASLSRQVKCFATSISIVLSCVLSIAFLGMQLSQGFAVGALMVRTRHRAPARFCCMLFSLKRMAFACCVSSGFVLVVVPCRFFASAHCCRRLFVYYLFAAVVLDQSRNVLTKGLS